MSGSGYTNIKLYVILLCHKSRKTKMTLWWNHCMTPIGVCSGVSIFDKKNSATYYSTAKRDSELSHSHILRVWSGDSYWTRISQQICLKNRLQSAFHSFERNVHCLSTLRRRKNCHVNSLCGIRVGQLRSGLAPLKRGLSVSKTTVKAVANFFVKSAF